MTEVVNIKVEGVVDELILNSMQVLNQAFDQASAINQAEEYALVFEFQEEVDGDYLVVTGTLKDDAQTIKRQFEVNESKTRKYA